MKVCIRGFSSVDGKHFLSSEAEEIRREWEQIIERKEMFNRALIKREFQAMKQQLNKLQNK